MHHKGKPVQRPKQGPAAASTISSVTGTRSGRRCWPAADAGRPGAGRGHGVRAERRLPGTPSGAGEPCLVGGSFGGIPQAGRRGGPGGGVNGDRHDRAGVGGAAAVPGRRIRPDRRGHAVPSSGGGPIGPAGDGTRHQARREAADRGLGTDRAPAAVRHRAPKDFFTPRAVEKMLMESGFGATVEQHPMWYVVEAMKV